MNITKIFLSILNTSLHQTVCEGLPELKQEKWEELYTISEKHSTEPMIYQQIFRDESFQKSDPNFQMFWKNRTLGLAGSQARRSILFLVLYEKMRQNGLHPLVVKGIVCRELYAQPDLRISNDEDLLIPREEFQAVDDFLLQEGFLREELESGKEYQEVGYQNPGTGIYLEIHMDLFAKESGAYGYLNQLFVNAFVNPAVLNIQGTDVYTLNPGLHFLYLICHSLKHFLHSGFGIRQLCDILLFAKVYHEQISWDELFRVMKDYHMYTFAMNLLHIGITYLGFSWEDLGFKQPDDVQLDSMALLDDMMDGGIFGKSNSNRMHSANITLNAMEKEKANAASGIFASLFPGKEYIRENYSYAKKHRILIPAAYIHRIIKYVFQKNEQKDHEGKSSAQIGMERVKLLEKYELMER